MKTKAALFISLLAATAVAAGRKPPTLAEIVSRALLAEPDLAALAGHEARALPTVDDRSRRRLAADWASWREALVRQRDFGSSAELEASLRFLEWRLAEEKSGRRRRDPSWAWEIVDRALGEGEADPKVLAAVPDTLALARRSRGEGSAIAWPEAEAAAARVLRRLPVGSAAREALEDDLRMSRAAATDVRPNRIGAEAWREASRSANGIALEPEAIAARAEVEMASRKGATFALLEHRFEDDASELDRTSLGLLDDATRHRRLAERYLRPLTVADLERLRQRDCRPADAGSGPLGTILIRALGVCPPTADESAMDRWLGALAARLDVRWHTATVSPGVVEDWLLRQLDEMGSADNALRAALLAWIDARPTEAARRFVAPPPG